MLALPSNANLLASHTMPDLIPDIVEWGCLFSVLPILAAALFGAKITAAPFRWCRVVGAAMGVVMGVFAIPFALILSMVVIYMSVQYFPSLLPDRALVILWIMLIFLMTSSVAYLMALTGRVRCRWQRPVR